MNTIRLDRLIEVVGYAIVIVMTGCSTKPSSPPPSRQAPLQSRSSLANLISSLSHSSQRPKNASRSPLQRSNRNSPSEF